MKYTKFTLITMLDGAMSYCLQYFFYAFMVWAGITLLDIYPLRFWQAFGAILLLRQVTIAIKMPSDLHDVRRQMKEKYITFAEWTQLNDWILSSDGKWYWKSDGMNTGKTSEELFNEFAIKRSK